METSLREVGCVESYCGPSDIHHAYMTLRSESRRVYKGSCIRMWPVSDPHLIHDQIIPEPCEAALPWKMIYPLHQQQQQPARVGL